MDSTPPKLLRSKLFWVGILYFAQGLPFGIFYDVLPVYFRALGVDLREIGLLALLGLAWTLKFLWAPAVDHYRHHRRWMLAVDLFMAGGLVFIAMQTGFGPPVWIAIALFAAASATNDIAIDGYTIELLDKQELGRANGIRIALYRVGILTAGLILILSDVLGWGGAYVAAALALAALGFVCLAAPREAAQGVRKPLTLATELGLIARRPRAVTMVMILLLATLWLIDNVTRWSARADFFWGYALALAATAIGWSFVASQRAPAQGAANNLSSGPMFGALMELLARPGIAPVIAFVLLFKLGDAAMGFMVKPFWVDAGFTATQIGLVSVNVGLALSIAGGIAGGWLTDRIGIFHALWILGLAQALSNLGYVWAAHGIPPASAGLALLPEHQWLMYSASALESFTGGLGTAAFLAFLMAIVNKQHAATEYAILSSIFALSRQLAGFASGFGAHHLGYADYFLLTFFLAFPAYLLLPWVRHALNRTSPG
jgi:PAT family beta-lactamase induction signal transducer AmpG